MNQYPEFNFYGSQSSSDRASQLSTLSSNSSSFSTSPFSSTFFPNPMPSQQQMMTGGGFSGSSSSSNGGSSGGSGGRRGGGGGGRSSTLSPTKGGASSSSSSSSPSSSSSSSSSYTHAFSSMPGGRSAAAATAAAASAAASAAAQPPATKATKIKTKRKYVKKSTAKTDKESAMTLNVSRALSGDSSKTKYYLCLSLFFFVDPFFDTHSISVSLSLLFFLLLFPSKHRVQKIKKKKIFSKERK